MKWKAKYQDLFHKQRALIVILHFLCYLNVYVNVDVDSLFMFLDPICSSFFHHWCNRKDTVNNSDLPITGHPIQTQGESHFNQNKKFIWLEDELNTLYVFLALSFLIKTIIWITIHP